MKCEYELILVKQNNSQCSLSAVTSFTGHTRFVYVRGSEKAKETEWLMRSVPLLRVIHRRVQV